MRHLALDEHHMTSLPSHVFSNMSYLVNLTMRAARLETLGPDVFSGLHSLESLCVGLCLMPFIQCALCVYACVCVLCVQNAGSGGGGYISHHQSVPLFV